MSALVTRVDSAVWKQLARAARQGPKELLVGVPEGAGAHPSGATIAEIALWNHEGTDTIPARPFLSHPLDARRQPVKGMLARVSKGILEGRPEEPILRALGEWCRNLVIAAINVRRYEANAPSTEAAKGSDLPLVDRGILKGAITYEVRG